MEQRNENKTELRMIKMSDVQSQTVDWLWYPFIPYGKLTIIQGDPGDGKTTLVLNIAARLSKGEGLDRNTASSFILHLALLGYFQTLSFFSVNRTLKTGKKGLP